MKNKIAYIVLMAAVSSTAFFIGRNTIDVSVNDDYINMADVTDYTISDIGLQLNMSDGSGYWLEIAPESENSKGGKNYDL